MLKAKKKNDGKSYGNLIKKNSPVSNVNAIFQLDVKSLKKILFVNIVEWRIEDSRVAESNIVWHDFESISLCIC